MRNILITLFIIFSSQIFAQYPEWASSLGDDLDDNGESVVMDQDRNVIVSGYFDDTITIGSSVFISQGGRDILVVKYDSNGNLLWANHAGSDEDDAGLNITADKKGNVYVGGYYKNTCTFGSLSYSCAGGKDVFIAKYNALGSLQWVKTAGGTGDDESKGLSVDKNGNVWSTGQFQNTCSFGSGQSLTSSGGSDTYVARYSASGNLSLLLKGGGANTCWPSGISNDMFNNAYITGACVGNVSFGSKILTGGSDYDFFVAKADSNGNWLWVTSAPGTQNNYGNGIDANDSGYVSVTGSFYDTLYFNKFNVISYGGKDGFIAQYDSGGNALWGMAFGGTNSDKGIEVAVDNSRSTYVTGFINGKSSIGTYSFSSIGGDDISIVKIKSGGQIDWISTYGSTGSDYGMGIDVSDNGKVAVTGSFSNTAAFGSISKNSAGKKDLYALMIDQAPHITQHPVDTSICEGDDLSLFAKATAVKPVKISWQHNGIDIPNSNQNHIIITAVELSDTGSYRAIISNEYGVDTSDVASITVHALSIVNLGNDTTLCDGESITLDAGSGYQKYYWSDKTSSRKNTVTSNQTLSVYVKDQNNCLSLPDTIQVSFYTLPAFKLGNDTAICRGDSVLLDAGTGFSDYYWSNGFMGSKQFIQNTMTITARVQDAVTACWSEDDSIKIKVWELPVMSLGADSSFCEGDYKILDVGSYYQNYVWSNGFAGKTQQITQSDTISLSVQDPVSLCWSIPDTIVLNMFPLPQISLGNDTSLCEGDSILLSLANSYDQYFWSDSLTVSDRIVSEAKSLWLMVRDANHCWSHPDTIQVSFNTNPILALNVDTSFCKGGAMPVNAGNGYMTYQWSDGYDQQSRVINSTETLGIYVIDSNHCVSNTDSIKILVHPLPAPDLGNDRKISLEDSIVLDPGLFKTYYWSDSSSGSELMIIASEKDTGYFDYWVEVTDSNGCMNADTVRIQIYDASSIEDANAEFFRIYPNPAKDEFVIVQKAIKQVQHLYIIDLSGKLVKRMDITAATTVCNVSDLPVGMYLLKLVNNDSGLTLTKRMIIRR